VVSASRQVITSFKLDELAIIYKLRPPKISLSKQFLEDFKAQDLDMVDFVKDWRYDPEEFKTNSNRL
jgi:hypothetical protein